VSAEARVWVLADDRAGHANQALGVADALGLAYEVKRLGYNRLARMPNLLLGIGMVHLARAARAAIGPPWPDIVIAAGRRTVPVARAIKRHDRRTFLAQCMWPGPGASGFDLVAVPGHDRVPARANLVRTIGAPHRVSPSRLAAAALAWGERLADVPRPRIALLVGGATRRHPFGVREAGSLAAQVSALARAAGASVLMTTSRRTPPEARAALAQGLAAAHGFEWAADAGENPYLAYLALADAVVVTGDSTAMCTEACATGRAVYIFAPPERTAAKHRRLHASLFAHGCARPLVEAVRAGALGEWRYEPLDDAGTVARAILARLGERKGGA
jgi:mitochondrial fission protein ELM1